MMSVRRGIRASTAIRIIVLAVLLQLAVETSGWAGERGTGVEQSDYGLIDLYQYHETDSLRLQHTVGFTAGWKIGRSRFVYEWQRPLISIVTFRSRLNKERGAATWGVMGVALAVPAWLMMLSGSNEKQIESTLLPILAPFGSHIGFRPVRAVTLYAGIIPDFILFTENNGLLVQLRTGVRIDLKLGFVAKVGYMKPILSGFKCASRSFPPGLSVGISFAPPSGSWDD